MGWWSSGDPVVAFIALDLDDEDFMHPDDRTERYTIIEISMFAGRSVDAKRRFIHTLFARLDEECGISPHDLEITITETPRHNWGSAGRQPTTLT